MSRYVRDRFGISQSAFYGRTRDFAQKAPPDVCLTCDDLGSIPDRLDPDRFDVMVPCPRCQVFCRACNRYVHKTDHVCPHKEASK